MIYSILTFKLTGIHFMEVFEARWDQNPEEEKSNRPKLFQPRLHTVFNCLTMIKNEVALTRLRSYPGDLISQCKNVSIQGFCPKDITRIK